VTERLPTPSKITAWLDCAHSLTLSRAVDRRLTAAPSVGFGEFASLLGRKRSAHTAIIVAAVGKRRPRWLASSHRIAPCSAADVVRSATPQ